MVRTRVFFGILLILLIVGIVALDAWLTQQAVADWPWLTKHLKGGMFADCLLNGALISIILSSVLAWGALEMGRLCRAAGQNPAVGWSFVAIFVMVFLQWANTTPLLGGRSSSAGWQITGEWLAVSIFVGFIWVLACGETAGAIGSLAATTWLIMYLGFFGCFVARIRMDLAGPLGAWAVLYHIAVVKFADIGAYFAGISLGRHKIVPKISPNKTLEGYLGGMAASVVIAVTLSHLLGIIMPMYEMISPGPLLTSGRAVVFGLLMGLIGQVGDLIESLIKRDAAIKDSGALVPTFGGVLDIIDSPLLTAPLAWWLLTGWLL